MKAWGIRRARLLVILFITSAAATVWLTGSWRAIADASNKFEQYRGAAEFEDYARSEGTTTAAIRQEFYDQQVKRYNEGRAKGLRECSFYWSNEPCLMPPREGTWARGVTEYTAGQNMAGVWGAVADAGEFFKQILLTALGSWAALYVAPFVGVQLWRWLTQPKPTA